MRAVALVVALTATACIADAGRREPPPDTTSLAGLTGSLRQALVRHAPVHACGPDRSFTSGRALLVLSARDCMSCRSAGYLLRQLRSRTEFDVLTGDHDVQEVCVFLRQEKAEGAVFRFQDRRFGNLALADRFLLFRRAPGGGITGAVLDSDVGRLLAQWDSLLHVDPAP